MEGAKGGVVWRNKANGEKFRACREAGRGEEVWFQKGTLDSYLGVEFVVTEVQGGVDWLERLKVDVDLLLFALLCHNGPAVHHQTIRWH